MAEKIAKKSADKVAKTAKKSNGTEKAVKQDKKEKEEKKAAAAAKAFSLLADDKAIDAKLSSLFTAQVCHSCRSL